MFDVLFSSFLDDKLEDLKASKKKIVSVSNLHSSLWILASVEHGETFVLCLQLEEVMETETYKNAKLILERFDPEAKKKAVSVCVCVC